MSALSSSSGGRNGLQVGNRFCTFYFLPPDRIANNVTGFDLVGEESQGRPLRDFVPELLAFQAECRRRDVEIPFLFHCGETLDMGSPTDGNLVDALLLHSKRIGHGFALPKHPLLLQKMRAQGVCVELCPISNEILGLTPRVNGHAMYPLLANNVHCAVSSDNGALFKYASVFSIYSLYWTNLLMCGK